MNAEMKLMIAQIEMAKMAATSIQIGQLATSLEMVKMVDELNKAIKTLQDQIAKEQTIIELNK